MELEAERDGVEGGLCSLTRTDLENGALGRMIRSEPTVPHQVWRAKLLSCNTDNSDPAVLGPSEAVVGCLCRLLGFYLQS